MTQRLARVCATYLRQQRQNVKHVGNRVTPTVWTCGLKDFGTGPQSSDGDDGGTEASASPGQRLSRFSRGSSIFGRRRPLSPLERVSQLLPQDSLSKEVWELRESKTPEDAESEELSQKRPATEIVDHADIQRPTDDGGEDAEAQVQDDVLQGEKTEEHRIRTGGGERTMCFGEALLAEYRRNRRLEFRKMFQLQEGLKLHSNWGVVPHQDIAGRPAGTVLRTSLGLPMLLRRPSLEEFTVFMKRGPAIAYPK
ncbi:hypothetical protein NFI96_021183, partial [Prochilodus magdalenae]